MREGRYKEEADTEWECESCGYPGDAGDVAWYDERRGWFCSASCGRGERASRGEQRARYIDCGPQAWDDGGGVIS